MRVPASATAFACGHAPSGDCAMYTLVRVCICAALACAATTASAYGARDHQVIGAIADKLLSPTASQNVNAILGMPLRVAATWADCAKDVKTSPARRIFRLRMMKS